MATYRVLVVEDSLTVRKRMVEVLSADHEIEVVGEAEDGKRAIELCRELRPDVITLDMMLPVMTGLAATEFIMAHFPTPILVVSASVNRGELYRTYDALAAGAVDVLEKPTGLEPDDAWEAKLVATVKLVSRIKVITHLRGRLRGPAAPSPQAPGLSSHPTRPLSRAIAIGASTGGPGALVEVLSAMPTRLPVPILIVLHIGRPFGTAFADWLDAQTPHRVAYVKNGESLVGAAGRVVMAPPEKHMVVREGALYEDSGPERHSCRPSVDVLFESLASSVGPGVIGCLLTGMGRDGASGLLQIQRAGGATLAQDEASSIVYGMPREAVLLGAADRVLPLAEIGPALALLAASPGERRP